MIDIAHIAELDAMLGAAMTDTLIAPMLIELDTAPAAIRALVEANDVALAKAAAHGLRGAALGVGCTAVAALCGRIETEAPDALAALAAALVPLAGQTADLLRRSR